MLSILIPTYNYNVYPLVEKLHNEAMALGIDFEINIYDDHSPNPFPENEKINHLSNSNYVRLEKNIGRSAIRNKLATESVYNNLLFLDADVIPENSNFLAQFISNIAPENDLIIGGIVYENKIPEEKYRLRWKYGKNREYRSVIDRKRNPYLSIISASFLIKKKVFLKTNLYLKKAYGIDVLFANNLQKGKYKILHINNPVIHLGLETNMQFVEKTKRGLETLSLLSQEKKIPQDYRPLQKKYIQLKKNGLIIFVQFFIKHTENFILKNLDSSNPSLFLFDVYRLYYYSKIVKNA